MAIFCYRDDEDELTEVSFPIGEAPPTIRVKRGDREVIARRSFQDEMGSVARPGRWPMWSDAAAIAPGDIEKCQAALARQGVRCEFDGDGRPKFESAKHRKAFCEASGMYDRDGSYGDPQKRS